MTFTVRSETPPLRLDSSGEIRIGQTRVLLELVVSAFQDGATPEEIVQNYDTLSLPDVYAVIAYYLNHQTEVDEYIEIRALEAQVLKKKVASQRDLGEIRKRLLNRRASQ